VLKAQRPALPVAFAADDDDRGLSLLLDERAIAQEQGQKASYLEVTLKLVRAPDLSMSRFQESALIGGGIDLGNLLTSHAFRRIMFHVSPSDFYAPWRKESSTGRKLSRN
jgi:hypothetical protein